MKKIKRIYKTFFEYEYCSEKNKVVGLCINDNYRKYPAWIFNQLCVYGIVQVCGRYPGIPVFQNYTLIFEQPVKNPKTPPIEIDLSDALVKLVSEKQKTDWVNNYIKSELDKLNLALDCGTKEKELCQIYNFDDFTGGK